MKTVHLSGPKLRTPLAPLLQTRCAAQTVGAVGGGCCRRAVLLSLTGLPCATWLARPAHAASAGDWSSPGLAKTSDGDAKPLLRTANGVRYELVSEGSGSPAAPGQRVQFEYTLRRGNGYFVYSTAPCGLPTCGDGTPFSTTLGDGTLIAGLDELLTGMRPGEKRRAMVPPELGYVKDGLEPCPPDFGQKRQVMAHKMEPLVFEVRLVKAR